VADARYAVDEYPRAVLHGGRAIHLKGLSGVGGGGADAKIGIYIVGFDCLTTA
jgi:hypothetical protein